MCGGTGIPAGDCDCDGNVLDACGECGGCGLDVDGDGLCDDTDNCTDVSACNFADASNTPCHYLDACGVCGGPGIPPNDCDCFGNQLDACGVCGGDGTDIDGDGICDDNDNCTDVAACNFDSPLNQGCLTYDECGVCGGAGIPLGDCDCNGNQLDGCGVCGGPGVDVDGDGVCDDIDNCTDVSACNFNSSDNTPCLFADECGVCGGSGIPEGDCDCFGNQIDECGVCGGTGIPAGDCDCFGNQTDVLGVCGGGCTADSDNNGVCDDAEVQGCTSPIACNYDPSATQDDGSCINLGEACDDGNALTFNDIYTNCGEPNFGCQGTGPGILFSENFQDDPLGYGWNGSTNTAAAETEWSITFGNQTDYFYTTNNGSTNVFTVRDGDFDCTWLSREIDISTSTGVLLSLYIEESGNLENADFIRCDIIVDGVETQVFNVFNDFTAAVLTQFPVPAGNSLQIRITVRTDSNGETISFDDVLVEGTVGCPDDDFDGICNPIDNCSDLFACNYDDPSNGTCLYDDVCGVCGGSGVDTDADGVCDDVDNCTDVTACNFDDPANGTCLQLDECGVCGGTGIPAGDCDCFGNQLDGCGVCGGSGTDVDNDGVCDDIDNCADVTACNFADAANGSCLFIDACGVCGGAGIPEGDCDCFGNALDACGVCGGTGTDVDDDGICDDIDNCIDLTACNYSNPNNTACSTLDECGVCGGDGIPAGDCDCFGNQLGACGTCGGNGTDLDDDGLCDEDDNCVDTNACNFDDAGNTPCLYPDECGVCGGCGIADGACDCSGTQPDALGVCGGNCAADIDGDGLCDDADNCTDITACNYADPANGTCAVLDECGVCGGTGIPAGDCDCDGNQLDACGVCGGTGTDADADGLCDDIDNCTDLTACNYADPANAACLTLDACGVCGGTGIPAGDCDCDGNVLDACGVCGGNGTDADSDGLCDSADNCTDITACNFDDPANGPCAVVDECGVCGGGGIPAGDCDCNGNQLDACGVCGGTGTDIDADGVCDDADNCTDVTACNFSDPANAACLQFDECGVCGGSGIPAGDCDCFGNQLDACGVCGGTGTDADADGVCDDIDNCTDLTACNYADPANVACLTLDECGICGGTGIPAGDCDCDGNVVDACGVCGGTGTDADSDWVCDDLDNCTDLSACNFSDPGNTACLYADACGVCGGCGIADGACDCAGTQPDALGVCGGTCAVDADGDGLCDDVDNCTDISACNYADAANAACAVLDECGVCGGSGIPAGDCDCFGNQVDACGECGGTGTDADADGICDDSDNCTDVAACNYADPANAACATLDECGVCGGSGIPAGDCDCDGNQADACGVCGGNGTDTDADGICDSADNCTDVTACNYDDPANGPCAAVDACGVCGGGGIPAGDCDCNGNQLDACGVCGGTGTDTDGDGICDGNDNCTDLSACNYDDPANAACAVLDECGVCGGSGIPAGDCDCEGNQLDACGECGGTGVDADADGVCDNADNCTDVTACNYADPANVACLVLDECGVCGGSGIPAGDCDCDGNQVDACGVCGGNGTDADADGICDDTDNCTDLTACNFSDAGNTSCLYADACGVCGGCGIADGACDCAGTQPDALGVCGGTCAADVDGDGLCDVDDNCTDVTACNYADAANGACAVLDECGVCGGSGIPAGDCDCFGNQVDACGVCGGSGTDVDGDGICDSADNCTDVSACNYADEANGACDVLDECGVCGGSGIPAGDCDCDGNQTDACGVCGGNGSDVDADGICDNTDNCTDVTACNYDDPANGPCAVVDECGVCGGGGIPVGDCDCNGNQLDACGVCGGSGVDADGDGICDDLDNCTDVTACNYDDAGNGACAVLDECGVCGGSGIPAGDCDCEGNQLDACGVCGGTGTDADGDGLCDSLDNCTDLTACNYADPNNGTCLVLDACGVCGGSGIPAGDCDCDGNQTDACGVCGGAGTDADGDGLCDDTDNCVNTDACNFDDPGNTSCLFVDECGVCGGCGIATGDCDCDGNQLDILGVCGGGCTLDEDGDAICDDVDNCTDLTACNFDDPANVACEVLDECGVCGGNGIPAGDCDCDGNQLDALGVCGGLCLADVDGDGICDDLEVPGCTNDLANNYNPDATDDDGSCEYDPESFLGITAEAYAVNSIETGTVTWRIYAEFANPTDQLVSVFGDAESPLLLSSTTDFFQDAVGGTFAQSVNPLLFPTYPTLEYDSWLTIGSDDNTGTQTQSVGLNVFTFASGGDLSSGSVNGGSWFITPDTEPTAFPDAEGKVLIAQVTTSGTVTFNGNILYRTGEGTSPIARDLALVFPNDCFTDLNQDGVVNINDLLIVLSDYGCVAADCSGDTNNNGVVGIDDILSILGTFGDNCY